MGKAGDGRGSLPAASKRPGNRIYKEPPDLMGPEALLLFEQREHRDAPGKGGTYAALSSSRSVRVTPSGYRRVNSSLSEMV